MPHLRKRHVTELMSRFAALWPVIGVVGLRQVGKSTLLKTHFPKIRDLVSMDDEDHYLAAERSAKIFLARFDEPLMIDEIQKVPKLFDAIKLSVDENKRPSRFFLTGSIDFSRKIGVRESLTGRIGIVQLFPLTLSETIETQFEPKKIDLFGKWACRHTPSEVSRYLVHGGLPSPLFMRDASQRDLYFQSWIETTIYRDAARAYGKNYDPDFAYRLLLEIARILNDGLLPSTTNMRLNTRKIKRYLEAFCEVFLLNRIACHPNGVGKDVYLLADTGIASHLMNKSMSDESTHSLLRIFVLNEFLSLHRYQGKLLVPTYFKSAKSDPVDLVVNDVPLLIVPGSKVNGWDTRSIEGMMKKLNIKKGIVLSGSSETIQEKVGISQLPWSYFS
jgi:predicted AAA+ superfamily ATPase